MDKRRRGTSDLPKANVTETSLNSGLMDTRILVPNHWAVLPKPCCTLQGQGPAHALSAPPGTGRPHRDTQGTLGRAKQGHVSERGAVWSGEHCRRGKINRNLGEVCGELAYTAAGSPPKTSKGTLCREKANLQRERCVRAGSRMGLAGRDGGGEPYAEWGPWIRQRAPLGWHPRASAGFGQGRKPQENWSLPSQVSS